MPKLPAHEIEIVVRDGLMDLLVAPDRLMDALGSKLMVAEANDAIRRARSLHQDIQSDPIPWADRLRPVLQQVVLEEVAVRVRIGALISAVVAIVPSLSGTVRTRVLSVVSPDSWKRICLVASLLS